MTGPDVHRTVEAAWRMESARLIAGLARMTGDVGLAEELAQDALVAALENWPKSGIPDHPGAWLRRSIAPSIIFAATGGWPSSTSSSATNWRLPVHRTRRKRMPRWTIRSVTICCA